MRWLPNLYATRLHAVQLDVQLKGYQRAKSLCGTIVVREDVDDYVKRRMEKGVKRCARCEKIVDNRFKE